MSFLSSPTASQIHQIHLTFPSSRRCSPSTNQSLPLSLDQSLQACKFLLSAVQLVPPERISIEFSPSLLNSQAILSTADESQSNASFTFHDADLLLEYAFNRHASPSGFSSPITTQNIISALESWVKDKFLSKMQIKSSCFPKEENQTFIQQVPHFEEFSSLLPEDSLFPDLTCFRRLNYSSNSTASNSIESSPSIVTSNPSYLPGQVKSPLPGHQNRLITAALPYVNNVPHLGNIIGCVLSADVFARYSRLRAGTQTLFICGTDEYGTATETKALEEGLSCQQLCDKYHAIQNSIYQWFDISFDHFGRTTTHHQTAIAQDIFQKLHQNSLLIRQSVDQLLCTACNRFLADRFVEGTCPFCAFPDARGDQCDGCGKLINAVELRDPKCKICRSCPELRSSEHLFLDLTRLQPECEEWLSRAMSEGAWSPNGQAITKAWLQEGLKPRCITRDLQWGTPVPLEEMKGKVFYVWFDAPIGYISITACFTEDWKAWWKREGTEKGADVKIYQFMGKDNVPFHSVIFPCSLLGTRENWNLVHHISTTEFLNFEGGKFSKSRNIGVFGNNVVDSQIPSSVWRYYLLANRPESSDCTFTWDDFAAKCNSELLANLGNFASRVLRFAKAKYASQVPLEFEAVESDENLVSRINTQISAYLEAMESGTKLKVALKAAMAISTIGNEYLTSCKLDNSLFVTNPKVCAQTLGVAVNLVHLLACLLHPFVPAVAEALFRQLNAPVAMIPDAWEVRLLGGHLLGEPEHLFSRLSEERVSELRQRYGAAASA